MRQALLVSVAALALAAGSTLALSQGQGGGQGGGGAGPSSAPQANPSGPSGGAGGATESAPGPRKGAEERTNPTQKQDQKSTQERTSPTQKQDQKSTQQERSQPGTQQRQTETPQQGGAKQGAQTGDGKGTAQGKGSAQGKGMASSNVSLTTEQKTTIRNTVINSGPKVTSVNFGIRVGVAVPRTVKFAPVPATIVEIQPAWRGYMYFVYEDEIIIVRAAHAQDRRGDRSLTRTERT